MTRRPRFGIRSRRRRAPGLFLLAIRVSAELVRSTAWLPAFLRTGVSLLLTATVVAAVSLALCLFVLQYRPDRQIDDAAAQRAIHAASDGAVATLSYSSENMDGDFARARSHLTGDFLAYYDKFTKEIVIPTVQQKHLSANRHRGAGGRVRTGVELGRRAGVPQRDDTEQGQAATADHPEQRANNAHEGRRFVVDLEVGSGGISATVFSCEPVPRRTCRCYSHQARTPLPVPSPAPTWSD